MTTLQIIQGIDAARELLITSRRQLAKGSTAIWLFVRHAENHLAAQRDEFYRQLRVEVQGESKPYPLAMVLPRDRRVYRPPLWVWAAVLAGVAVLALLMWR